MVNIFHVSHIFLFFICLKVVREINQQDMENSENFGYIVVETVKQPLHKKMKFSSVNVFLRIWSHLLKKSLMENFIFCAVN